MDDVLLGLTRSTSRPLSRASHTLISTQCLRKRLYIHVCLLSRSVSSVVSVRVREDIRRILEEGIDIGEEVPGRARPQSKG